MSIVQSGVQAISVLIDTWWNVNVFTVVDDIKVAKRFNRYMVECESISRRAWN